MSDISKLKDITTTVVLQSIEPKSSAKGKEYLACTGFIQETEENFSASTFEKTFELNTPTKVSFIVSADGKFLSFVKAKKGEEAALKQSVDEKPITEAPVKTEEKKTETAVSEIPPAVSKATEIIQQNTDGFSISGLIGSLKQLYEVALQLSKSDLIPKAYLNKPANCMIAMEIAGAMKMPALMVMQNLDVIHGNTSWRGKFLKALIEQSGIYLDTWYEEDEAGGGRTRLCAKKKATGMLINGPWVSMEMAKAEKWIDKEGSKWKTMPDLMRKYRAASFFSKTECPHVTLGFPDEYEAREVVDIEHSEVDTTKNAAGEAFSNLRRQE